MLEMRRFVNIRFYLTFVTLSAGGTSSLRGPKHDVRSGLTLTGLVVDIPWLGWKMSGGLMGVLLIVMPLA
jgi:hypothetical protein